MSDDNLLHFKLRPTPQHATDAEVHGYWELATALMRATNPEMFIDLQRRYEIKTERRPSLLRLPEWQAIDALSFDPEPGATHHVIGVGETEQDARMDLLEKLNAR
jgi:hypothetical protein